MDMNFRNTEKILSYRLKCKQIIEEVEKVFLGNREAVRKVLMTLLAGGHVLLEDIPGVGKTTLATAFSKALDLDCNRIQFTPDIMPSDVTGFTMLRQDTRVFEYKPGAAMCNLLLADEINRASARSQSALLEAMEENAVTVDGVTHALPQPFMVIATQNPYGSSGTQLLPDSQTDRFMMCLSIGYPNEKDELELLRRKHGRNGTEAIARVTNAAGVAEMRQEVAETYIHKSIYAYILHLVRATRSHELIVRGASPRCSVALAALAQAAAYISGRDFVIPEDVQMVFKGCTAHRIVLSPQAKQHTSAGEILLEILRAVKAPTLRER